MLDLSQI